MITSAGTAAGIDACLHLVRTDWRKVAAAIARDMVVPPHRDGGQAQYIDRPIPQCGSAPMEQLCTGWSGTWSTRHGQRTGGTGPHVAADICAAVPLGNWGHPGGLAKLAACTARPGTA